MSIIDLDKITSFESEGEIVGVEIEGYRYSIFPHKVLVYKGDAVVPTYTIDREDGCDCKSATLGGRICKHMQPFSWFSDDVGRSEAQDALIDLTELLSGE